MVNGTRQVDVAAGLGDPALFLARSHAADRQAVTDGCCARVLGTYTVACRYDAERRGSADPSSAGARPFHIDACLIEANDLTHASRTTTDRQLMSKAERVVSTSRI